MNKKESMSKEEEQLKEDDIFEAENADSPKSLRDVFNQPPSVWTVAFACVAAFLGLGCIDPILPSIAGQLHASSTQTLMLFTAYMFCTGIIMLFTGFVSSRIGAKQTLLLGLGIIIGAALLCAVSGSVNNLIGMRAGWGVGNALFISTALAVIVGATSQGAESAVILYEAAIGIGMAIGPLIGGTLGMISWRAPFVGVALLMVVGFLAVLRLLKEQPKPKRKIGLWEPLKALSHGGLLVIAITSLFYNYGYFTLFAYSPFVLAYPNVYQTGIIFFFWGVAFAISSVLIAPKLQKKWGTFFAMSLVLLLFSIDLLLMGFSVSNRPMLIVEIIIGGALIGLNNTFITTAAMEISHYERPIASSAYSFVRYMGGALGPLLAGIISGAFGLAMPFYTSAIMVFIGFCIFVIQRRHIV